MGPGNGGTVGGDDGVTVPGGGKVQVGDSTITLPSGSTVKPNPDGSIPLPGGTKVERDGQEIIIPDGGVYHPEDDTAAKDVCTITFDSQGGSTVSSVTVTRGEKARKPGNPVRSGYTFGGWYKERGCTTAWNFDADAVTGNITLYAKWTAVGSSGGNSGGNSGGGGWYNLSGTYSVTIPDTAHGEVTVSPTGASRGTTVTITAFPKEGYRQESLKVLAAERLCP